MLKHEQSYQIGPNSSEQTSEDSQVGQLEGSHWVGHSKSKSFINIVPSSDSLFECQNCLVNKRKQKAVGDESRRVLGKGDLLSHRDGEKTRALQYFGRSLESGNELDELHDRNGVHKVEPDYTGRVVERRHGRSRGGRDRGGGDGRNGDGRGVGGEDRGRGKVGSEETKDDLFKREMLRYGL